MFPARAARPRRHRPSNSPPTRTLCRRSRRLLAAHRHGRGSRSTATRTCLPRTWSTPSRQRQDVPAENVIVGAGSVAVLAHLLQAYAGPGREVVYAWRSFEAYPILTALTGATPVTVPLADGGRHDLDAMAAADHRPHGRHHGLLAQQPHRPRSDRRGVRGASWTGCPPHVLVILDEAYVEFVPTPRRRERQRLHRRRCLGSPPQRRRPAHHVQGLRTGGPARRLRLWARRGARRQRARA